MGTSVILIVVVSLALGTALMRTGGADYLASLHVAVSSGFPTVVVLGGLMLVMAILTKMVAYEL